MKLIALDIPPLVVIPQQIRILEPLDVVDVLSQLDVLVNELVPVKHGKAKQYDESVGHQVLLEFGT